MPDTKIFKKNMKRCICYRIMLLLKIYLANGVILYVDRNQAKRVEKEDEGCDGKKKQYFFLEVEFYDWGGGWHSIY